MNEQEIIETIERKRRILLRGNVSHRRLRIISQQIDSLQKELDNGRVFI